MKKILWLLAVTLTVPFMPGCNSDDDEDLNKYKAWKEQNETWLAEMQAKKNPDGTPYYQTVVPGWNPSAFILMHYFNDRSETAGNLSPLYTSSVDVRYIGYNCEGEPFDSSTVNVVDGKLGINRFLVNQVIQGWSIALMDMHVGDTAEIIVPSEIGYGAAFYGNILPYSTLRFNIRLEDIHRYEATPY